MTKETFNPSALEGAQEALILALEIHIGRGVFEASTVVVLREDIRRARSELAALREWLGV